MNMQDTQPKAGPHPDVIRMAALEAAILIEGYEGTAALSLEAVAAKADMPLSTVQSQFATIEDIQREIPDYLEERKANFLSGAFTESPMVVTAMDRMRAVADSYFEYFQEDPELYHYLFEEHSCINKEQFGLLVMGQPSGNVALDGVMRVVQEFAVDCCGGDETKLDPADVISQGVVAWATVHGMGHLSILGILRHQHAVVRRYNFSNLLSESLDNMMDHFAEGRGMQFSPLGTKLRPLVEEWAAERPNYSEVKVDDSTDVETLRPVIIEAVIDRIGADGVDAWTLHDLAEDLGLKESTVVEAVENEFVLRETVENLTDEENRLQSARLIESLPEGASALDMLRALAVSYFHFAVSDPTRYNALVSLATKSVVPSSNDEGFEMSGSFKQLSDLVRAAMVERGVEPADHDLYLRTLTLWAGVNGIAHLCALGDLSELDLDIKWYLLDLVTEVAIATFKSSLRSL